MSDQSGLPFLLSSYLSSPIYASPPEASRDACSKLRTRRLSPLPPLYRKSPSPSLAAPSIPTSCTALTSGWVAMPSKLCTPPYTRPVSCMGMSSLDMSSSTIVAPIPIFSIRARTHI